MDTQPANVAAPKNGLKRTIKFLTVCHDPGVYKPLLSYAPDSVIKVLCNAAGNVVNDNVTLSDKEKKFVEKYRKGLELLASSKEPLQKKRKLLIEQKNGSFLVNVLQPAWRDLKGALLPEAQQQQQHGGSLGGRGLIDVLLDPRWRSEKTLRLIPRPNEEWYWRMLAGEGNSTAKDWVRVMEKAEAAAQRGEEYKLSERDESVRRDAQNLVSEFTTDTPALTRAETHGVPDRRVL